MAPVKADGTDVQEVEIRNVALVQSRMTSRRLPGKALMPLAGRPMLQRVLERLTAARTVTTLAVTTSTDPADDPIAAACEDLDLPCYRGPLDDVLARIRAAARELRADAITRISGDSPLIDPCLVDRAATLLQASGAELVTNVHPRTYPVGQSVELLTMAALDRLDRLAHDREDREHVTSFAYRHPADFEIANFGREADASGMRMAVDTLDDAERIERMLARMTSTPGTYDVERLIALLAELENLEEKNAPRTGGPPQDLPGRARK